MSLLGHLSPEDPQGGMYTVLRLRLAAARARGDEFDAAWERACRALQLRDDDGVVQFARPRFERAYQRLSPSVPACQHPGGCDRVAVEHGRCPLHVELPVVAA